MIHIEGWVLCDYPELTITVVFIFDKTNIQ